MLISGFLPTYKLPFGTNRIQKVMKIWVLLKLWALNFGERAI